MSMSSTDLVQRLQSTADSLRDCTDSFRSELAATDIPDCIVQSLRLSETAETDFDRNAYILEAARVAANLVVDNDDNREILAEAGYVDALGPILKRDAQNRRRSDNLEMKTLRAIIASLLNLSVGSCDLIKTQITSSTIFSDLFAIANGLYLPFQVMPGDSSETADLMETYRATVEWIWKVIDECIAVDASWPTMKGDTLVTELSHALAAFSASNHAEIEARGKENSAEEEDEDEDDDEEIDIDTHILGSCCSVFDKIITTRPELIRDLFSTSKVRHQPIFSLLDFLEFADVPTRWRKGSPATTTEALPEAQSDEFDAEKFFGQAKAIIMKTVCEFSAEVNMTASPDYQEVWARISAWVQQGVGVTPSARTDLISCGLLIVGNQLRNEQQIKSLFDNASGLRRNILDLLSGGIEDTQIRFALIGLLRNLLLPDFLKDDVGKLVLETFQSWGILNNEVGVQILGPLIGSSVVVIKHVCRNNVTNATILASMPSFRSGLLSSVMNLAEKNDDEGIRSEASRIFVEILKSIWCAQAGHSEEILETRQRLADERIVRILENLVQNGNAVLLGEGVVGMVLLAKEPQGARLLADYMFQTPRLRYLLDRLKDKPREALTEELDSISLDAPQAEQKPIPIEIRSNICLLLVVLAPSLSIAANGEAIRSLVLDALHETSEQEEESSLRAPISHALQVWVDAVLE